MSYKMQGAGEQASLQSEYDQLQQLIRSRTGKQGGGGADFDAAVKRSNDVAQRLATLKNASTASTPSDADKAWSDSMRWTSGQSDQLMADPRIKAALDQLQGGMDGPYTDAVQNQLISRNADSSAYAEGTNAEELRNQLAARGVSANDPSYQAALRELQGQRQASNLAFAGDTRSKATIDNYTAGQDAARNLASLRLGQYGQAQTGYSQAANLSANRQFSDGHTAFTSPGGGSFSTPQNIQAQAPSIPQSQDSPWASTPAPTYGTTTAGTTPAPKPAPAPAPAPHPTPGTPEYTAWYQQRYGAGAQPGMSGTGRDSKGNLINPTPMAPATGGNFVKYGSTPGGGGTSPSMTQMRSTLAFQY